MRDHMNLRLSVTTIDQLRELAKTLGCPIGELADLFLRRGLNTARVDALKDWASGLTNRLGRNAGMPGKLEQQCRVALGKAMDELDRLEPGAKWCSVGLVAKFTDLRLAVVYGGLVKLQSRGLASCLVMKPHEVDAWERPKQSLWALNERLPDHLKPKSAKQLAP